MGEKYGDRYSKNEGYQDIVNEKQKQKEQGIKQGYDRVYSDPKTRSPQAKLFY